MTTSLISVTLAVVLFLVANYFEDEKRWQKPPPGVQAQRPMSNSTFESPLRTISAAENCEQTERKLVQIVDEARECTVDADCTIFDFGYPIQCLTSVAKSEITRLRLQYRRYETSCDFRVYYDCPSGHLNRQPVCRNMRCSVELSGVDDLTDDTLDYLGIE